MLTVNGAFMSIVRACKQRPMASWSLDLGWLHMLNRERLGSFSWIANFWEVNSVKVIVGC